MEKYKAVSIYTALKNHRDAYTDAYQQGYGVIIRSTLHPVDDLQSAHTVDMQRKIKINLYK